jgi:predicted XRE-type DNA-binding protein
MSHSIPVRTGSGNVFADLGIENPEEYLGKSDLAERIQAAIVARGLTQKVAGALLGISQPKVSTLLKGRLEGFSTDRLFRFLTLLGGDIEIRVSKPLPRKTGRVSVVSKHAASRRAAQKGRGGMSLTGHAKVFVTRRRIKRVTSSPTPAASTA